MSAKVLRYSLVATFFYVVLTVLGGVRAHSLALLSEAGHNVTDLLALVRHCAQAISLFAQMAENLQRQIMRAQDHVRFEGLYIPREPGA